MHPFRIPLLPLLLLSATVTARSEWTHYEVPAGLNSQALWFTNATTGFIAGSSVWKTEDGAATWKKLDVPAGYYQEIRFRDPLTGFVAGNGALYKTTDGGTQWQSIGPSSITFKSLALGGEAVYGLASNARQLWKSGNGGVAWDTLGDMGTYITELAFSDSLHGCVSSQTAIFKTTDGGKQWRKVYTVRLGGLITDMQFLNADTGYASAYYPGSIMSTFDGGETWKEESKKSWLYGLNFSDPRQGCLAGISLAEIFCTADAGATWVQEATGSKAGFRDLHFPSTGIGYVLESGNTGLMKFSAGSTALRREGNPIGRGRAPYRRFDIRGARFPHSHGASIPYRLPSR